MGVDLEMQGAAVLKEALGWLAVSELFWSLDQLPLTTLVVSDEGAHILLNLSSWHSLLKMENISISLLLLPVDWTVAHAGLASLSLLLSNHVHLVKLHLLVLIDNLVHLSVCEGVLLAVAELELVSNEGTIKGGDSLEVDGAALDNILNGK